MFQCKLLQLHRHCVYFAFSVQVPNIHILGLHMVISISFKKGSVTVKGIISPEFY